MMQKKNKDADNNEDISDAYSSDTYPSKYATGLARSRVGTLELSSDSDSDIEPSVFKKPKKSTQIIAAGNKKDGKRYYSLIQTTYYLYFIEI